MHLVDKTFDDCIPLIDGRGRKVDRSGHDGAEREQHAEPAHGLRRHRRGDLACILAAPDELDQLLLARPDALAEDLGELRFPPAGGQRLEQDVPPDAGPAGAGTRDEA